MIELKKSPVRFDADSHTYWLGNKQLNGVTSTLVRRAFPDKYKDVDPEVLANAARKGHELHELIEYHDNFGTKGSEHKDPRVESYERIKRENCLTTVANEYLVSDNEHYASSIDIVMQNAKDEICLADLKTTWNLDRQSVGLQLSIYKRLFEQQNPDLKVSHIYVIWLPNKDTSIAEIHELCVVDDETLDNLIEADQSNKPFAFELIPDEWADFEKQYRYWLARKEEADNNIAAVKEQMMLVMQNANIATVRTDYGTVSYIPSKQSQRFDSLAFRKDNKDLYEQYMRPIETAAQIRVLPKKI